MLRLLDLLQSVELKLLELLMKGNSCLLQPSRHGERLSTSKSDVCGRQILTSEDCLMSIPTLKEL